MRTLDDLDVDGRQVLVRVDFNVPLGVDKLALGDKVKVELDLQFSEPSPASE